MPYIIIKIVNTGTTHIGENGITPSLAGHMWYNLVEDNGTTHSYGFAPSRENEGKPYGTGSSF